MLCNGRLGEVFGHQVGGVDQSAHFVYFRSPEFVLKSDLTHVLYITARQSPHVKTGNGNDQGKLLCSFKLFINGQVATVGPGHNLAQPDQIDSDTQVVRSINITSLLRPAPMKNVVAVAAFFNATAQPSEIPRVQALLCLSEDGAVCVTDSPIVVATGPAWLAWAADAYHNPTGNSNFDSWYAMPNEDLDRRALAVQWSDAGFTPPSAQAWIAAVVQPAFDGTIYLDVSPSPAILTRPACSIQAVGSGSYLVDFGQEFSGGVNLSFPVLASTGGWRVTVTLAETVHNSTSIYAPSQANQLYRSVWTLAGTSDTASNNHAIMQHEMIQFRFALIENAPSAVTGEQVRAWVVQHAVGGTGHNPYEYCAASQAVVQLGPASPHSATTWTSSSATVDAVFQMCAYTAVASAVDINVDSRTRQRDMCHVDGLITNQLQYAVFPAGDATMQARTALFAFSNDSAAWGSSVEFRLSGVVMADLEALEMGDFTLAKMAWASSDAALTADSGVLNALQFFASVRYFNSSGRGLLSFPKNCGAWSCSILADWPQTTRDGYDADPSNTDDAIRNGYGAIAIRSLARLAGLLGYSTQQARYDSMANTIVAAMRTHLLRSSGNESFFVDGATGPAAQHAAIHSTLYAAAAGVADGDAELAGRLSAYVIRRDMGPASCMTGKWVLEAAYRLARFDPTGAAAEYALELLARTTYPSWGFMRTLGATLTLEAWRPQDKWNMDWGHPWCAYPGYALPRLLLGVEPLTPGWTTFRIAPQPGSLERIAANVSCALGSIGVTYGLDTGTGTATLGLVELPEGTAATVCLVSPRFGSSRGRLTVDGAAVATTEWGRSLCTAQPLTKASTVVLEQA